MEQNIDQTKLLQALYSENLSEVIQLREERAVHRIRIADLEARIAELGSTEEGEDADSAEDR